ncbi:MAG: putative Ig domain-containing protein [Bryobacterales bacterium]|nr:putative Ig domain-containing protein [Bryobacterales bacterium]
MAQFQSAARWNAFAQSGIGFSIAAVLLLAWATPLLAQTPTISTLTPNFVVEDQLVPQEISVAGTGFVSGSVVVFGATDLVTTFDTATSIKATIPTSLLSTPGTVNVTVRNPAPGNETSAPSIFTIVGIPTISALNPDTAVAGSPGFSLTVTGTNFVSASSVVFDGSPLAPDTQTSTQLTVTIPAGSIASAGAKTVLVRNPGVPDSNPATFTVAPALTLSYPSAINGVRKTAITGGNPSVGGGTGSFTYTLASGTLPAGLKPNPTTGVIEGTPTQAGTASVTVKVTDSGTPQQTATSGAIEITITNPPIQVVTLSPLPGGTAGTAYTTPLTASGGDDGPYTWSTAPGSSLPAGLTLSGTGELSGTPQEAGVFSFTVQVDDGDSNTAAATKLFSLTIVPVITSLNPSNRAAGNTDLVLQIVGRGFKGGATSVQFGGTLIPTGSVAVTGSPVTTALLTVPGSALTTPGDVPVTVTVNGATSNAATFTVIGDTTLTISNESNLGTRTAGLPFSVDLEATGGNGNFTWSVATGSTLPGGLSLNPATGVLSGTPNAAGAFNFTIRVVDDKAPPSQSSGQKAFTLTIQDFVVSTTTLPQARVGLAYSAPLALAGGPTVPPADYQWTLVSGAASLPDGIAFNPATGTLSGIPGPISAASQTFTVRVSAKHGPSGLETPVRTLQLTVSGGGLDISASSLPFGVVNQTYGPAGAGVTLTALNGTAPYRFEVNTAQAAQLAAAGFRVDTVNDDNRQTWNVRISGTPTIAGSFRLDVTLRDAGNTQVSRTFTVLVLANALSIQPESLPGATVNTDYSQQMSLSGRSAEEPTVTWTLTPNVPGLSVHASTGLLSGRFTTTGARTFTIQASTALREVTRTYTLAVGGPQPAISTPSLPSAQVGQRYEQLVTAAGGTPGYTWQLTAGALPQGLNFDTLSNPGSARIVGTPTSGSQSQTFTLTVRDSLGQTASREFTIAVTSTPIPAVTISSFTNPVPAEQKDVVVQLAQPYPVELKGTATLTFTSNAPNNVDDPKVLFLNGRRTADFTIPVNSTQAVFEGVPVQRVQTGTVAGTARVTVAIQGGGPTASQEFTIARSAPFLADNLAVQNTAGGFTVVMTGYSTPRDLTSARVTFVATAGTTLQTTELTIPLTTGAASWFDSSPGRDNGSTFKLTIPFTVQNGSNAVSSVTVTLTNSVGTSNSRTRAF